MNVRLQTVAGAIALICFPVLAHGVVIQQENGEVGAKEKRKTTMYLDNGKIRVESEGQSGKSIVIFDGDKQVLWMIQPDNTYMEMTQDTVAGLGQQMSTANDQMSQAMKQMQEKMASLPPQQRAMMEQAMKGRGMMPGAAAPQQHVITFQAKGGSDKVGNFTCTKYDELTDGKRTAELCAASPASVQLKEADLKSLQALRKFLEPMEKMIPRGGFTAPNVEQLKGFPVHSVNYDGDKPTFETTVLSVEQKPIEASLFTLPAGLQKKDMFGGRGRGPR
jgi:hypothetical protein